MRKYQLAVPTQEEADHIDDMLMEHNSQSKPFEQEEAFIPIHRCAKDEEGNLLGGILAYSVMWHILYIDTLWVAKECRGQGIGTALLQAVEQEAKAMDCHIAHLDTFDFQGKGFYLKNGYAVFGVLEDSPKGHQEFFLCKKL